MSDDVEVAITIGITRPAMPSPLVARWTDENGDVHERIGTLCDGVAVPAGEFMKALRAGTMEILIESSRERALTVKQQVIEA